jgi:hypothetical protein
MTALSTSMATFRSSIDLAKSFRGFVDREMPVLRRLGPTYERVMDSRPPEDYTPVNVRRRSEVGQGGFGSSRGASATRRHPVAGPNEGDRDQQREGEGARLA